MACPRCGSSAPPADGQCVSCGLRLTDTDLTARVGTEFPTSLGTQTNERTRSIDGPQRRAAQSGPLIVDQDFGSRYHIIRLLGIGGMGAVYQAWDKVLEVAVAVKVIRAEEGMKPEQAERVERRFKRELLLARQVTHKNVVRIHDLGEIDGITYITMPYVQGSDLATILRREGALAVDRVLAIARQVGSGLAAAHEAGVVHRDLKPANIMVEAEGNALIMDFGIARSTSAGMTMTHADALIGTIDFMAPEQASGKPVDGRADIYAFGLILNDMLLGRRQGEHTSSMAALMERMVQPPVSVRSINSAIPEAVDAIVTKCLQPDPALRFQKMTDLLAEVDRVEKDGRPRIVSGTTTQTVPAAPAEVPQPATRAGATKWRVAAAAVAAVVIAGSTAWVLRDRFSRAPTVGEEPSGPGVSVAVLPFRNASSDRTLDSLGGSLSQVLSTMLGESARVRSVPSDRIQQVLQDLRIAANANLAPADLTRIADLTSARRVLWGQYARFGNAIRIDATLQDLDGEAPIPLNAMAPNEEGLLTAIGQLAGAVQRDLAQGSVDILNELKSSSWKPSTRSFEALRRYDEGVQLTKQGAYQAALKSFESATKEDPNFALALSALARTYSVLGYDDEAGTFSRRAMNFGEGLPPQEKYLIAANHYRIVNDTAKAIEAYEKLAKASPNNATVQFDLGGLYEQGGQLDQAAQHFAKVVELDPKFAEGQLAVGRVEIRRGNAQASLDPLNKALSLAVQLNNDEARANVLQAMGVAYKRMGRQDDALKNYQASLELKQKLGNKRGIASSLSEIAQIQIVLGQPREAEQTYKNALKLQREIGDKAGTSTTLINLGSLLNDNLGKPDEALPPLQEALLILRDAGNKNEEALALNNIGGVYFNKGQYSEAQTYYERALQLREQAKVPREIADTLHNLAETLAKMGRYDQSLTQYLRALDLRRSTGDRRAAAIESYSIGTIFDYQGRYGAAIKAKQEALATFRELKQRDIWFGEILSGSGNSLGLSGHFDEAAASLDEAMNVARELKNPNLSAQTLRFQADRSFYRGDLTLARDLGDQAVQAAAQSSDKSVVLLARATAAKITAATNPTRELAATFARLAQDADTLGLKSLSVECSIRRADTLLKLGDRAGARQEAERAIAKAESLGFRLSLAVARFTRAEALRVAGDAEARREYAAALRLLTELKEEDGNQGVLTRADVGKIYSECERWSKSS